MQTALQPPLRELPHKPLLEGNVSVLEGKLGVLVIHWSVCLFTSALASFPSMRREISTSYFSPLSCCLGCPWAQQLSLHIPDPCGIQGTPAQLPEELCEHLQHLLARHPQPSSPIWSVLSLCRGFVGRWLWEVSLGRVTGDYGVSLTRFDSLGHLPVPAENTCSCLPPLAWILLFWASFSTVGLFLSRSV